MNIVPKNNNQINNNDLPQNQVELYKQDSSIQRFKGIYSNRKSGSEYN